MTELIFNALDMVVVLIVAAILLGSYHIQGHGKNKLYKSKRALAGGWFMVLYFLFLIVDNFIVK